MLKNPKESSFQFFSALGDFSKKIGCCRRGYFDTLKSLDMAETWLFPAHSLKWAFLSRKVINLRCRVRRPRRPQTCGTWQPGSCLRRHCPLPPTLAPFSAPPAPRCPRPDASHPTETAELKTTHNKSYSKP